VLSGPSPDPGRKATVRGTDLISTAALLNTRACSSANSAAWCSSVSRAIAEALGLAAAEFDLGVLYVSRSPQTGVGNRAPSPSTPPQRCAANSSSSPTARTIAPPKCAGMRSRKRATHAQPQEHRAICRLWRRVRIISRHDRGVRVGHPCCVRGALTSGQRRGAARSRATDHPDRTEDAKWGAA